MKSKDSARIARRVMVELELVGQQWDSFGLDDAERICVAIAYSIGLFARGRVARVACVACGRVVRATLAGRPVRHSLISRLAPRMNLGPCDGSAYRGDSP